MKPLFVHVTIATVFIAGSILSPLLFLLPSSGIAYSQTPDQALSAPSPSEQQQPPGSAPTFTPPSPSPSATTPLGQTPDQALSAPTTPSPSNPSTAQPEEQEPQPPGSQQSAIPGLLFPPEQPQQQPPASQEQLPSLPPSPQTQPIPTPQPEQPPAVAPLTQTTANGTIDSLIFAPGTKWIATGNWSMVLRNGNVNSFNADMTWYNNNGTGTHTHELLNFKSNPIDITVRPGDNVLMKGLMDVGTNHRISWTNVHSIIDIKGGKTISISLDDRETNKHFAGQTIYGVVKSFAQCSDQPGANMEVLAPCSSSLSFSSPPS
jgi:hypothetical protein